MIDQGVINNSTAVIGTGSNLNVASAVVEESSSRWVNSADLTVGDTAQGSLSIGNFGQVLGTRGWVGRAGGGRTGA